MTPSESIAALARGLRAGGLNTVFGITGSARSMELIHQLESLGVRYRGVSHESAAAIMSGAVQRAGGGLSAAISIKGPGLANLFPGVLYNFYESVPSVTISEAYGSDAPHAWRHKRLDHGPVLGRVVKALIGLDDVEKRLPSLLERSQEEIPGPIHVELAEGVGERYPSPPPAARMSAGQNWLGKISSADRPAVIAGSLSRRRRWGRLLADLRIPLFTTAAAKGVVDERLDQCAGVFTGEENDPVTHFRGLSQSDLVVGIGLRNTEVVQPRHFGRITILADEVSGDYFDGFGAEEIFCMPESDVEELLRVLAKKSWGLDDVETDRRRLRDGLIRRGWLPAACFDVLDRIEGPMTLALDTGSFCRIGELIWRASLARMCLGSHNGRYMGGGIPTAIGASIGRPDAPVFCAVGDGGMGMYPAEIRMAIEEQLPICFVFMTDGRYGGILSASRTRSLISARAVTVDRPSWWKPMEALGCEAREVRSPDEFSSAVCSWGRRSPLFLECAFDPESYVTMLES